MEVLASRPLLRVLRSLTAAGAWTGAACAGRPAAAVTIDGRLAAAVGPCVTSGSAWQDPPNTVALPGDSLRVVPPQRHPRYPRERRLLGEGGEVVASFAIDTAGRVDPRGVRITASPHAEFSAAVCAALPRNRFTRRDGGPLAAPARTSTPFRFTVGTQ